MANAGNGAVGVRIRSWRAMNRAMALTAAFRAVIASVNCSAV
jgi:hypothetical protein